MNDSDLQALERLVVDNPDLERLEALLDQFNIFEAIGAVHQELRHSDFLAFLLNPNQSHGLHDIFIKRLLQRVLQSQPTFSAPVSLIDLDIWNFSQTIVLREWQNIDILLLDEGNQFAVIIENKIHSGEHSDQLQRYRRTVERYHHGWRVIGLFLTPDETAPSDTSYIPVSYRLLCDLIEDLNVRPGISLNPDARTLLLHYAQMLRRHVLQESEIAQLSKRIYAKHQRAIDLIIENRPDELAAIHDLLMELIEAQPTLALDQCNKRSIRFYSTDWDSPQLSVCEGWTPSNRILLFQFDNLPGKLTLELWIGPGSTTVRERISSTAIAHGNPFHVRSRSGAKWKSIFARTFLLANAFGETSTDEREAIIRQRWQEFISEDLTTLARVMADEVGKWDSPNGAESSEPQQPETLN
jgi:hypothetical protein